MSLYPSLEDLKVDKVMQLNPFILDVTRLASRLAQSEFASNSAALAALPESTAAESSDLYPRLYPELSEYMGLNLHSTEVQRNLAVVGTSGQTGGKSSSSLMIAPVTGNDVGLRRAEIKHGIREVILCKDQDRRIGIRVKSIDNGIFLQLVQANSPASMAGMRFGDQILQINGENCAGWSTDKTHQVLKDANDEKITIILRDRPFQRTITMHKDSTGHVGFIFKNGKIISIVKDSSAARNGLLTDHSICEINGQNVIGLKDTQIADILGSASNAITITLMPSYIQEHMLKRMASSIVKQLMDRSLPEV